MINDQILHGGGITAPNNGCNTLMFWKKIWLL